jgi:hypothetical protein
MNPKAEKWPFTVLDDSVSSGRARIRLLLQVIRGQRQMNARRCGRGSLITRRPYHCHSTHSVGKFECHDRASTDDEGCTRWWDNRGCCSGMTRTWRLQVNRRARKRGDANEVHLVINVVPVINSGLETVAWGHLDGRRAYGRIAHSAQHYSDRGWLGILGRWWERRCSLLRYHTRAGEKVSMGSIAGRIVQRVII